jgi:fucose 4-O-acetylase-like acetyltransferase
MNTFNPIGAPRFEYIDALRGFAILLVVIGHALQYGTTNPDENALFLLIYAFHMPLFMFVSGFVYSGFSRPISTELRNKALTLLLPFLAWLPVTFIWTKAGSTPISISTFVGTVIASPDAGGLWFLWVLFLINLVLLAARRVAPKSPVPVAWFMWVLLNIIALVRPQSNILGIKLLCWHLPFFLAGFAFRKSGLSDKLSWRVFLASSLAFLVFEHYWVRIGPSPLAIHLSLFPAAAQMLLIRAFNYLTAFLGVFAVFSLSASLCRATTLPGLNRLGRISLEIYATHIYFLAATVTTVAAWHAPLSLRVPTIVLATLVGALLASWVIQQVPLLANVMFGTRNKPTWTKV